MKFEEHEKLYIPVFATLKYYYPLPKWKLYAGLDPGYGIYPREYVGDGFYNFSRSGALYLSGGIGITGASQIAPYASVHFTKYGFTEHIGPSSQYRAISTFTFTAGLTLNKLASGNIFDREKPSVTLPTREEYERRSEKQKKAAWIILGSGVVLFGGGIYVAAKQNDGEEAAIPLVFISGTGIVTSLVSVPFFISSGVNKRRAMHMSSYLEMQRAPLGMHGSLNSYPALAMKLAF